MSNELIAIIAVGVSLAGMIMPILMALFLKTNNLSERVTKLETEMDHIKDTIKQAVTEVLIEYGVMAPTKTIETASLQDDQLAAEHQQEET